MCQNKRDSQYASGSKYAKILNMVKDLRHIAEYGRVLNMRVLYSVLNMPAYALTEF